MREAGNMCASCGCLRGDDDHGEPGHITLDALKRAALVAGITMGEVVNNIRDTYDLACGLEKLDRPAV
jgi:hypothetical protein